MWLANHWKDYEVIDTSKGEKLERWGDYLLIRPDPQVIWNTPTCLPSGTWTTCIPIRTCMTHRATSWWLKTATQSIRT